MDASRVRSLSLTHFSCRPDVAARSSLALTATAGLLERHAIDPNDVGRLEVGTETLVDKSKSTKTVLMDLFPDNPDVEGATVVNACYGGTAALLNAFAWVESDAWDGRYAIVVAADIAAYAPGPARPTGGAGAVAVLVGRDAPLALADPRERATHAANAYDFFKPDPTVEYPVVDGALSQACYYRALEGCYARFCDRVDRLEGGGGGDGGAEGAQDDDDEEGGRFHAEAADYFVFHAPYNKLVQKSYGRLHLLDARRRRARARRRRGGDAEEKKRDEREPDHGARAPSKAVAPLAEEHLVRVSPKQGPVRRLLFCVGQRDDIANDHTPLNTASTTRVTTATTLAPTSIYSSNPSFVESELGFSWLTNRASSLWRPKNLASVGPVAVAVSPKRKSF